MGLFGKIKDILFEEEEVVIDESKKEVKPKPEIKPEVRKEVAEPVREATQPPVQARTEATSTPRVQTPAPKREEYLGERELFQPESSSPFFDFDEEEFSSLLVSPNNRQTNVMEYERKKKTEKRTDYGRVVTKERKEVVERKKFKPSPIISPVYGILNEDYRIEDIKNREDTNLDIESVRKKAFEPKEEPKIDLYEEESVTVKYTEDEETKAKKGKTIDDLLADTSDEVITVKDKQQKADDVIEYDEEESMDLDLDSITDVPPQEEKKEKEIKEDAVDEELSEDSDLFDLIDSIYESREDGE